jgi:cytoskeletal protein CcmA (bactofilin family)
VVVSSQRVKNHTQHMLTWQYISALYSRLIVTPVHSAAGVARHLYAVTTLSLLPASESDTLYREFEHDRWRSPRLPERGQMLFRRETQGESFDDDVAALRDQAGTGRRAPSEVESFSGDDQTTYSPPRQSWSPISTESAGDLDSDPTPSRMIPEQSEASIIAVDTSWDGKVQSSGSLHVHGRVSGEIRADGDVYVAEGASVAADVHAGSVTVAGSLEGTVECTGRFEVLPSGRVSADVAAPRLVVHEGAVVVGKLRMTTADDSAS